MNPPFLTTQARRLLLVLSGIGVAAFIGGIGDRCDAGLDLRCSSTSCSGLVSGHAGVAFSAIFCLTSARWARPLERVAEATIALPSRLCRHARHSPGRRLPRGCHGCTNQARRARYVAQRAVSDRAAVLGFLLLAATSLAYVDASLRPDAGRAVGGRCLGLASALGRRFSGNWRGLDAEILNQPAASGSSFDSGSHHVRVRALAQAFRFHHVARSPLSTARWQEASSSSDLVCIGVAFLAVAAALGGSHPALRPSREQRGSCTIWDDCCWVSACCGRISSGRVCLVIWYERLARGDSVRRPPDR